MTDQSPAVSAEATRRLIEDTARKGGAAIFGVANPAAFSAAPEGRRHASADLRYLQDQGCW